VSLVDTNGWLERLLDQTRSEEVGRFLAQLPSEHLYLTDFAFHSIGVVLSKLDQTEALLRFVKDAFVDSAVTIIRLEPQDTESLVHAIEQFHLDFDDAYQYVAAEKHDLTLVSLDEDFDRTERRRKTPAEIVKGESSEAD